MIMCVAISVIQYIPVYHLFYIMASNIVHHIIFIMYDYLSPKCEAVSAVMPDYFI